MNMQLLMDEYDISIKVPDIDLTRMETEWRKFRSNIPELWKFNNDGREFQVGEQMKSRGLTARYPVILVPGIISTVCPLSSFSHSWSINHTRKGLGILVDLS